MPLSVIDGKKLAEYLKERIKYTRARLRDALKVKEYGHAATLDGRLDAFETTLADLEDARLAPKKPNV